jgi:hypothetical protein
MFTLALVVATLDNGAMAAGRGDHHTPKPEDQHLGAQAVCGPLAQEAEAAALGGRLVVASDGTASGGRYIHAPVGSGDVDQVAGNTNTATFCFTVATAGTYRLKGRVHAATTARNSFFVQVDGAPGAGYYWNLPQTTVYQLDYVNDRTVRVDPVQVALGAGQHTVTVYQREEGARLDTLKLELVSAGDPAPSATPTRTPSPGASTATATTTHTPAPAQSTATTSPTPLATPTPAPPVNGAPYPQSPVITGMSWAPVAEIARISGNADNWPITWADDGNLYTAFGDGSGFDNSTPRLSLGFAKVAGMPQGAVGTNIRSSGEQYGDGSAGKKASGMLMVDGVVYMWVRNAVSGKQCQLAWSNDRGSTWTWSNWTFAEFGTCTFINYGQNYAGARDEYIYMVTHDNPSAYTPADRFILTRVPKGRVTDRQAYEFFVRRSADGGAEWSSDIGQRGAVFTHAGKARRSGISYNAALGRYLWWQGISHEGDERLSGGFGVYDAPEPWGPWTTVYYTAEWDVGPGETASFPTKWMSADGQTVHLVFSGNDRFSIRRATLNVAR